MHVYIYIYIYISSHVCTWPVAERVLEYGVRAPVFCGNLREQTGEENSFPRNPAGILVCSYRHLRKSPETSGSLRESAIQESCTPAPS